MAEPEENNDFQKRILPVRRIFMLSSLLFSIGYSYVANEGFGIPLLLEAGLSERYAPIVFGISSIVSVFVGEYLGSASDRCTSILGRRRPFIIGLSIIVLIAAIAYPYGGALGSLLKLRDDSKTIYIISHTAVCVVIFDVFLDMTNSIDRSYLVDSITTHQSDIGNSIFSALTSAGSCVGAFVSSLDWEGILKLSTGGQTKVVFVTIIILLFVCISLTLNSVKEPCIGKDGKIQQHSSNSRWTRCYICCNYFAFDLYRKSANTTEYELEQIGLTLFYEQTSVSTDEATITNDSVNPVTEHVSISDEPTNDESFNCQNLTDDKSTSVQDIVPSTVSNVSNIEIQDVGEESINEQSYDDLTVISMNSQSPLVSLHTNDTMNQHVDFIKYKASWVFNVPIRFYFRILGAVNFIRSLSAATVWLWMFHLLEWVAALCLNFFITNYVGSVIYNGSADGDPNSQSFRNYNKGIRMGFACQSIGYGSSFIFSLLFKRIITVIRLRELCIGIHVLTFVSAGLLIPFNNIYLVAFLFIVFGWFGALVQIIPFTIIQQYKVWHVAKLLYS